jgi:hypothetical protein
MPWQSATDELPAMFAAIVESLQCFFAPLERLAAE